MIGGFEDQLHVLDTSAAVRAAHPLVSELWAELVINDRLLVTPPFLFEILFTARNRAEFEQLEERWGTLRRARFPPSVWDVARGALRELAGVQSGYHRVRIADALIAAAAQENAACVLHYNADFDRLARVLTFDSRWLAPAGTL